MTQRRVLGIMGSPRRGGNTETLMDEVLRAAREACATTEKVILNGLHIGPCQACDGCQGSGTCVQDDDMPADMHRNTSCIAAIENGLRTWRRVAAAHAPKFDCKVCVHGCLLENLE